MPKTVRPTAGAKMEAQPLKAAIKYAGYEDWIAEAGDDVATGTVSDIATGPKNAFQQSSTSGLTFTIDTGEAFIGGAYVAADETSSFDVPDESTTTLYVGYSRGGADQFRFGDEGTIGTEEPKVAAFEVTASGGSITDVNDIRPVGRPDLGGSGSTGDIPLTRIRDGERARNVEYVASGEEFQLTRFALLDENGGSQANLAFEIRDLETNSSIYQASDTVLGEPLGGDTITSISGARALEISVYNATGSEVVAGATYNYEFEET